MSFLRKRSTAVLIAAFVIIFGTLLGVYLSLNRETAKIEAQFYNGVFLREEKYVQTSIQSQLDKRADAALGLLSVANKYVFLNDIAQKLREAREELLGADTIAAKYEANVKLENAWKHVYESLVIHADDVPPAVESYVSTLRGAQTVIEKSDYNRLVSEFRDRTLRAFPLNILKNLVFAKYPVYFGPSG
jgi:hypothetical protein